MEDIYGVEFYTSLGQLFNTFAKKHGPSVGTVLLSKVRCSTFAVTLPRIIVSSCVSRVEPFEFTNRQLECIAE